MADITPYHKPGDTVTCRVGATAVVGGRFVAISGDRIDGLYRVVPAVATAAQAAFGVASRDKAVGANVMVFRPGTICDVEAGAAITAGSPVKANATGQAVVATAGQVASGIALDAIANGARGPVDLRTFTVPA